MKRKLASILAVTASGAVLAAGYSIADVPDSVYQITDKKEADTQAYIDVAGSGYAVDMTAQCAEFPGGDSPVGSSVRVYTVHPDSVKLKNNKGEVAQEQKNNQVVVELRTGSGDGELLTSLICSKAEAAADIKVKKTPFKGSFSASGKDCVCDEGDCGSYASQLGILATDCENNKSVKGSFKDGSVKKFKIKGKGDATFAPS
jgi:hypothetical protein